MADPSPGVVRRDLLERLDEVRAEASDADWDGYGAEPVGEEAYRRARGFIQVLPTEIPKPEIAPDADGDIAFDWYVAPRQTFNATVGSGDMLLYAGLFGKSKIHGREELHGTMPMVVSTLLERLFWGSLKERGSRVTRLDELPDGGLDDLVGRWPSMYRMEQMHECHYWARYYHPGSDDLVLRITSDAPIRVDWETEENGGAEVDRWAATDVGE